MQELFFWKNWSKVERLICSACLFLMILNSISVLLFWYRGIENIVNWDILSELEDILVEVDSDGSQKLINKAYLVKEQFIASKIIIESWPAYSWLGLLSVAFSLILAAISAMSRKIYLIGIGLVIVVLAFCHFEILQPNNQDSPILIGIVLVVLCGLTYYFNAFREDISILTRFFIFFICFISLTAIIGFITNTTLPTLTFVSYALPVFTAISLLFIIWLSFEILSGFVFVVSNRRAGMAQNSFISFVVISILYLSTILLLYFKQTGQIEANYLTISPIILILISIWLGLWNFRLRSEAIFDFRAIGVWLYLGLSLILTATLGYLLATDNSPLLELIETTFVYAQLTLGTIFIFYVGINFWPLFKRSYEVHKVLFKPLKFSLWQTWIISLVGLICLFGYDGSKFYYKFEAGRYDLLGDLYTAKSEYKLAEEYYKVALSQDFMNHRTNYALASLALTQGDRQTAGAYFRQAIQAKGTPQAYIGLSNALADEGLFFDAIFNLRNGNATFPKSGEIQNNLGYLYSKTNILDSTFYYYNLAQQNANRNEIPEANLAAFFAKNSTINPSALNQNSKYNSLIANQLILNKEKTKLSNIELIIPLDSGLSVNNFAYLYNRAVFVRDTNQLVLIRKLESKTTAFYEELQTARAFVEYYNGNKIDGLDLLASQVVSDTSSKTILARNTLTFWLNKEANSTLKTIPTTLSEFQIALQKHPLDLSLLVKATDFFNKNKQPNLAYQAILKTLRFRPNSPECQKIYILQCINMGYSEFARDGLNVLFSIASPTDYDAFMKIYEAKKSEMESKLKQF